MRLRYVSLFSGIEAFSVAASRIKGVEWEPVFFSEIDPFASAVLAQRFPTIPNLGDVCKIKVENGVIGNGTTTIPFPDGGIDILAGGSPCQDVSVAGRRAGMQEGSGTRSSLAFEYARLVEELRPRFVLWENVPGVLSSNNGLDFLAFVRSLVERGYGVAWRVLDAQYARVDGFPRAIPQRRRRVWLVGCLGADERGAAEILFERAGVLGDSAPRLETGKGFAAPAGCGPAGNGGVVERAVAVGNGQLNQTNPAETARTLDTMHDAQMCVFVSGDHNASSNGCDVANTLPSTTGGFKPGAITTYENHGQDSRVKEIDVSDTRSRKDGTGGNNLPLVVTPQQAVAVRTANTQANGHGVADEATHTLDGANGQAVAVGFSHVASGAMLDCQPTPVAIPLKRSPGGEGAVAVGFKAGQSANGGLGDEEEVAPTMSHQPSALEPTVAVSLDRYNQTSAGEVMNTLKTNAQTGDGGPTVATMLKVRCGKDTYVKPDGKTGTAGKGPLASSESAFTLAVSQDQTLCRGNIVRRLTPGECESLQGFPQGWTRIPWRGKPEEECPDSPRYRALGNSWACNCAEWVLRRVAAAAVLGLA